MRYLLLTYYRKANGQIDEAMAVARNLKPRDHQTCNVILDFGRLQVIKASMGETQVPKDFNRIVEYYMQHYESTIQRLFAENGYVVERVTSAESAPAATDAVTAEEEEFLTAVTTSGQFTLDQARAMYAGQPVPAESTNETDPV